MENAEFLVEKIGRAFKKFSSDVSVELLAAPRTTAPDLKNYSRLDLIMVLGGDGTILGAARQFASWKIPIVGVNFGEVGFLCAIESLNEKQKLLKLIDGDYRVENRMLIKGRVFRKTARPPNPSKGIKCVFSSAAFSEIAVKSTENNKMVAVGYSINGNAEEEIRADGIMVATPTGSTGYSLSCDGPIVMPPAEVLIVNAIAPHTLRFRPIIAEKNSRVTFRLLRTKGEGAMFFADMQEKFPLQIGDKIEIIASPTVAKMIFFQKDYFLNAVRKKLR